MSFNEYINSMDIFAQLNILKVGILLLSLLLVWNKDTNIRWMLLSFLFVEVISYSTLLWAKAMPIGYYAWNMAMNVLIVAIVFGRRFWLCRLVGFNTFNEAFKSHKYTIAEIQVVLIFLVVFIINLSVLLEVYLYSIYWIDNAYLKLYFRDYAVTSFNLIVTLICFNAAIKAQFNKGLMYETNK